MRIAITGKLRSGKDAIGKQLVEMYSFEEFKFSAGITKLIQDYFPFNVYSKGKLREHYQTIGQSVRKLDENVWIRYTDNQIQEYLMKQNDSKADIVITDLRQQNEAKYLRENGFTVIKVEALSGLRVQRAKDSGDIFNIDDFNHETELSVDDIRADYVLENNGTLEELTSQMNRLMMSLCYRDIVSDPLMNSIRDAASKALEESFSKRFKQDKGTIYSLDNSKPRLEKRFYNL